MLYFKVGPLDPFGRSVRRTDAIQTDLRYPVASTSLFTARQSDTDHNVFLQKQERVLHAEVSEQSSPAGYSIQQITITDCLNDLLLGFL